MHAIRTEEDLEIHLSDPTLGVLHSLERVDGDVLVLGASGKMGPTLTRMCKRALDQLGQPDRRVIAVARFSSAKSREQLQRHGIETIACDLMDRNAVEGLPESPNIIYMAGQKFGTHDTPEVTWAANLLAPAHVAQRFANSRIVVFSTGCVYPLVPSDGSGATETFPLEPHGEYANSCVGRERIFEYFAKKHGTSELFFRLCYAVELRYGVLHDVACKVAAGQPVDISMGAVNVIWQRDANARAIQCLERTSSPPSALNVTGMEKISIRWLAEQFGKAFGCKPHLHGVEGTKAWLWDASQSHEWFGPPSVSLDEMIEQTARWILGGGGSLNKPTHYEVSNGRF